jgi:hypothetical protein
MATTTPNKRGKKMTKITVTNDFHNTSINLQVKGDTLTRSQMRRVNRELCGMSDCCCGDIVGEDNRDYEQVEMHDIDGFYNTLRVL